MKIDRSFKRLSNAGPISEGIDSILTYFVVGATCAFLAFWTRESYLFVVFFLVPTFACVYGLAVEIADLAGGVRKSKDGK